MAYTTTQFIANVKRRAAIPTSQSTYTNAGIMALGDAELRSFILPMVMNSHEMYYAYDVDTALNATGIYEIPTRSIGGKIVDVALVSGDDRLDVDWITEDSLVRYDQTPSGSPGVCIKRNQMRLIPVDGAGFSSIRQTILIRPGQFVETSACAQITAINTGTNTVTFATGTIPATFVTSATFDFIQNKPHFDHLAIDQTATSITTTTMVFSSLSSRLAVGDWVSLAEESCIVQCPVELQPLLEQSTANTILRAQGDLEKAASGEKELKRMVDGCTNLYTPRIEQEGKKLVNRSNITRRL